MRCLIVVLASTLLAGGLLADEYPLGPESQRKPDVPQGKVTHYTWAASKIFPGTTRDYWIYVPAQYDAAKPACVMIFQDGGRYVAEDGSWRASIVFDNLIAAKVMPVTIGIFVDPGVMPALSVKQQSRFNRSYEYDSLGERYGRFLIEEILPEAGKLYNLSDKPDDRALAGSSSGGIAAFSAAWYHPEAFHRVLMSVGSFTNLRGGDVIASMIRKTEPKPLRIFLQDGNHDLNIYAGSWWLANQQISWSLEFMGYETRFVTGTEGHNAKQGGSVFPDALKWLWQDYPKPVAKPVPAVGTRVSNTDILDPASDWELVGEGYKFTEGPASDKDGNVYFCDVGKSKIHKVTPDGKVTVFKEDGGGASGLMVAGDGRLYAAEDGKQRIVSWSLTDGSEKVLAEGVHSNDLAISTKGDIYFTDPPGHQVWLIDKSGAKRVVYKGMQFPNGVRFSPDEGQLMVADSWTRWVWSFQVQPDGSLTNGEPFYRMEIAETGEPGQITSWADGLAFDTLGYMYAATRAGIQVCDQPGRVVSIIRTPGHASPSNLVFGGPDMQTLYVTIVDKVYRRHLNRKGYFAWEPFKPPVPSL